MNFCACRRLARLLLLAWLWNMPGTALAEWPVFSDPEVELGIFWDQRDLELQDQPIDDDELRTSLEIRQTGYWSDPRIVYFNYFLRPVLASRDYTPIGSQDIELLNYRVGIEILRGAQAPVEAAIRSSLTDNDYQATLAGDTASRLQEHSLELRWKYEPFPMQFTLIEQDFYRKSSSVFSNSIIEREDRYRKFRIRGRSSKLSVRLDHETREDILSQAIPDLQNDTANINHRFDWGKNSQARSRLEYRRRIRERESISRNFSQFVNVQHTDRVDSELDYQYESASGILDTTVFDARYALNHDLYSNLYSSGFLFTENRSSESEEFSEQGAGASLDYRKTFNDTNVSIGLDYRRSDVDRDTVEGLIEVLDEVYVVPDNGRLVLPTRLIDRQSVIITDGTGSLIFLEGIDYQLLDFGQALLIVDAIPGGDIAPGQPILVSYIATQNPSGEYRETVGTYNLSVSHGGWYLSHYALRSDNQLLSGVLPSELTNRREYHSQLDYNWSTGSGDFSLSAKRDYWADSGFSLDSMTYTGSATIAVSPSLSVTTTLTHMESVTEERAQLIDAEFQSDILDSSMNNLRLDLDWRLGNSLTLSASLVAWKRAFDYRENTIRSWKEDVVSGDVKLDYRFRKFSASLRLFYNDWEVLRMMPDSNSLRTDDGFQLAVRRAF